MKQAAVILIFHDINAISTCPPEQFFVPTLLAEFARRSPPLPLYLRVSSPLPCKPALNLLERVRKTGQDWLSIHWPSRVRLIAVVHGHNLKCRVL